MFNTLPANPFPPSSEQMGAGGGGSYELPVASAETLGGVKVGNNLSIDDGVLSAPAPYSLPTASAETLGGVKVGSNLSIDDGVLSAPAPYTPPAYSTNVFDTGNKWIDGKNLFCKVVDLGNLPNATTKSVLAGLSDYYVLMIDGWYQGASVSNIFNLASLANFIYDVSTDSVVVNVGTDLSSFKAFAIIYCTEKESEE